MSLIQLIYMSDLVNQDEAEIAPILQSCHYYNQINGITGMLLYSEGNFLQILEGKKEDVHETYDRICEDPRHCHIVFLSEEETNERSFAHWSMGYIKLGPDHVARFPKYAPFFQFGFSPSGLTDKPGLPKELLKLFSDNFQ